MSIKWSIVFFICSVSQGLLSPNIRSRSIKASQLSAAAAILLLEDSRSRFLISNHSFHAWCARGLKSMKQTVSFPDLKILGIYPNIKNNNLTKEKGTVVFWIWCIREVQLHTSDSLWLSTVALVPAPVAQKKTHYPCFVIHEVPYRCVSMADKLENNPTTNRPPCVNKKYPEMITNYMILDRILREKFW